MKLKKQEKWFPNHFLPPINTTNCWTFKKQKRKHGDKCVVINFFLFLVESNSLWLKLIHEINNWFNVFWIWQIKKKTRIDNYSPIIVIYKKKFILINIIIIKYNFKNKKKIPILDKWKKKRYIVIQEIPQFLNYRPFLISYC